MTQFANTDSITATDMNNLLRGLDRDNTNNAHTGDTNETDLSSFTITGGTLGATGILVVIAAGTVTNSGSGAKTIRLDLGSTTLATVSRTGANAQDWSIVTFLTQTATNAQRAIVWFTTTDALTTTQNATTASEDSTGNLAIKLTAELANSADTITSTIFTKFVVQVT